MARLQHHDLTPDRPLHIDGDLDGAEVQLLAEPRTRLWLGVVTGLFTATIALAALDAPLPLILVMIAAMFASAPLIPSNGRQLLLHFDRGGEP